MNMFEFRRNANSGEWCAVLVPMALWITAIRDADYLQTHKLCFILSPFLVVSSLIWAKRILHPDVEAVAAFKMFVRSAKEGPPKNNSFPATSARPNLKLSAVFLLAATLSLGIFEAVAGFAALTLFDFALPRTFQAFKRSFTFGEGCVVVQSIVLFVAQAVVSLAKGTDNVSTVEGSFAVFSKICLMSVMILLSTPFKWAKTSRYFFAYGISIFCGFTYPSLLYHLQREPLTWIVEYIVGSKQLLLLFLLWVGLVVLTVAAVASRKTKATTSVRKLFHAVALAAFMSGVAVDKKFTFLVSSLLLGIFVIVEFARAFEIQPVAKYVNDGYAVFLDEKDEGSLVLTNVYLFAGTFLPLWIEGGQSGADSLFLFSGVLSIGVGDSAASVVGSKIGRFRFPNSKKTVEGTLACIVAQLLFVCALGSCGLIDRPVGETVLPICAISAVEALTTQVDNIVLPLMLYIMFRCDQ